MKNDDQAPDFTKQYTNLASPRLGGQAIECSDDFFASMDRMLNDKEPVFIDDKYDDNGKWMDGWESRRRRGGGHDWCIVKLGAVGKVRGIEIDTRFFTGNFPPEVSIEAANCPDSPKGNAWREMIPIRGLKGDRQHFFAVLDDEPTTHLRVNIFPDGGIARLRVFGDPIAEWQAEPADEVFELSALKNGGRIVDYNDAHYGNVWTMLTDGRGQDMGDGWETRRRREPGNDWIIVKLGAPGTIERIEVDTAHFKGNYPDMCSMEGALVGEGELKPNQFWRRVFDKQKLQADSIHEFGGATLADTGVVDHVRLNIFPDGGISRLRVFGRLAK